ncbi:MAG: insulinase family protein [Gemmatales bacterium]|nr:insulinase family protein [Gemmatales bacterium]MDW8387446.1 pitrilysin family protein [Gemmatales bacterium]
MQQEIHHHTFDNGLTLVAEHMPHVRSAAFNFLVPAGCAFDPPDHLGLAEVLTTMLTRGAGSRDSRQLSTALDNLGLDRDESVGVTHIRLWGATLARNLPSALEIYADILRQPHLPPEELEAAQALALQELHGLEDEPKQKALVALRRQHFPDPLGRDRRGTVEGIESLTPDIIRQHYQRCFQPHGTILSVAGSITWKPLLDLVGRLFGDWQGEPPPPWRIGPQPPNRLHIEKDTHQTQIALAYPAVPVTHPQYYDALGMVNVLSGGMSARLFTEVREKHGLCYAIWATYQTFKDRAAVIAYAGTTNDRAQQTLDRTLAELRRLADGIEEDEVARVQAGLKSTLIMSEESTSARAGSIASDWYYLGRVRSLDEIQKAIEALTPGSILDYVRTHPLRDFTLVTLGPKPLKA